MKNLIINRDVSGGYCKTAVSRWPFSQLKIQMKPKEKSKELIHHYTKELLSAKYSINGFVIEQLAKQCALIAVEEILSNNCGTNTDGQQAYEEEIYCDEYFWHDVKSELQSS